MRSTFPNAWPPNPSLKSSVLQDRASSLKALVHRSQNVPRHRNHLHSHLSRAGEHSIQFVSLTAFRASPIDTSLCESHNTGAAPQHFYFCFTAFHPRFNTAGARVLLNRLRVLVHAPLMQNQFRRPPVAVGHKSNLSIDHLEKIIAIAFWKYLNLWLSGGLHKQMIAFPRNGHDEIR